VDPPVSPLPVSRQPASRQSIDAEHKREKAGKDIMGTPRGVAVQATTAGRSPGRDNVRPLQDTSGIVGWSTPAASAQFARVISAVDLGPDGVVASRTV